MTDKEQCLTGKPRLLIIEDNLLCQQAYFGLLKDCYQIDLAVTANQALTYLDKGSYHCIILDLGLPDRPGEELLKLIRCSQLNKNTPVLVASAHINQRIEQECLALGATGVFTKPIAPKLLTRMVQDLKSRFSSFSNVSSRTFE